MSTKSRVFCVSAGLTRPKKSDNPIVRRYKYLNYGLLSLAGTLRDAGFRPEVTHGEYTPPAVFARELTERPCFQPDLPVLLSLPSSYALPWAREFTDELRATAPGVPVVVGGRWVVDGNGDWIRTKLPAVDLVVFGQAEDRIIDMWIGTTSAWLGGIEGLQIPRGTGDLGAGTWISLAGRAAASM